jgi:phospholipid-transporting ATPase
VTPAARLGAGSSRTRVAAHARQVFDAAAQGFVTKTWADVRVGDVITVHKDEYFPADLLFLSSESEEGLCYIETMQLDGETNLKIKKAPDETKHLTAEGLRGFEARART